MVNFSDNLCDDSGRWYDGERVERAKNLDEVSRTERKGYKLGNFRGRLKERGHK